MALSFLYRAFVHVPRTDLALVPADTELAIEVVMCADEVTVLRHQVHRPATTFPETIKANLRRVPGRSGEGPDCLRLLQRRLRGAPPDLCALLSRPPRHPGRPDRAVPGKPITDWVTQQACNICVDLAEQASTVKFLTRTATRSSPDPSTPSSPQRHQDHQDPVRVPGGECHRRAIRGTARRECLDRMLVLGRRHLEALLGEILEHYNWHRPHWSLSHQVPSIVDATPDPTRETDGAHLGRTDILGGLILDYRFVA